MRIDLLLSSPQFRYYPVRTLGTGFIVYGAIRSTSQLEGYHLHLRLTLVPGSKSANARTLDAVQNSFDFQFIVTRLVKVGRLPSYVGHPHLHLYDALDLLNNDLITLGVMKTRVLPGWPRLRPGRVFVRVAVAALLLPLPLLGRYAALLLLLLLDRCASTPAPATTTPTPPTSTTTTNVLITHLALSPGTARGRIRPQGGRRSSQRRAETRRRRPRRRAV